MRPKGVVTKVLGFSAVTELYEGARTTTKTPFLEITIRTNLSSISESKLGWLLTLVGTEEEIEFLVMPKPQPPPPPNPDAVLTEEDRVAKKPASLLSKEDTVVKPPPNPAEFLTKEELEAVKPADPYSDEDIPF